MRISEKGESTLSATPYRVPSADPWKRGGTGLNLALVQRLAEHLGGSVCVESAVNKLTTFTVELPHTSVTPVASK